MVLAQGFTFFFSYFYEGKYSHQVSGTQVKTERVSLEEW